MRQVLFRPHEDTYQEMKMLSEYHGYSMARFMSLLVDEQMKRYKKGGFRALICDPMNPIKIKIRKRKK